MATEHDRDCDEHTLRPLVEALGPPVTVALEPQGDYGGDEETTLPPPPPDEPIDPASPGQPSAYGDFRTHETTFAAMGDGGVVEVKLVSERGDHAHFAMDRQLAARVASDLERQLYESSHSERQLAQSTFYDRFLSSPPPHLSALAVPGTDVLLMADEVQRVSVKQEPSGDRIILGIWSDEASLRITMQGGVAVAVWKFLARAAGRR